jgi:GNAT superfamily N-acetyltransferase
MIAWTNLEQALTGFKCVANNLRESFRALAWGREHGSVVELPGISIASLGVAFQMFNAAFLSAPVEHELALDERLRIARDYFSLRGMRWAFWICEDWIGSASVRRKLSRACESAGLRLSSEMPGLAAERLAAPSRELPALEYRRVESEPTRNDFCALGASCFHVPIGWFAEVFNESITGDHPFVCWVGYRDGEPVATAATISYQGVIGLYNVATAPESRRRGCAEAITRHAIAVAARQNGAARTVLQSTSGGLRLYQRIGFQPVTRILVYNSVP